MTVTMRSFAKINLGLRIGAARPDGFHELLTVYQTIGLHDEIRISVGRGRGIEIRCADPRVPKDESNTCFRIVEEAMRALRAKGRVLIEIEKRLPVQGGLGGASSNAVATMLGLERALRKSLSASDRLRIAAIVGSDLPLFLMGGTVLGIGRGEQVYPLQDLPAMACVVVTPEVGVSTPAAFAEWDRSCGAGSLAREALPHGSSSEENTERRLAELRSAGPSRRPGPTQEKSGSAQQESKSKATGLRPGTGEGVCPSTSASKLTVADTSDRMNLLSRGLSAWLSEMHSSAPSDLLAKRGRAENPLLWLVRAGIENDFERVVFPEYPELSRGKSALLRAGAKYASLSGSGSTLYGLFASRKAANLAAARLRSEEWAAQATVTLTRAAYWRRVVAG
ncbi:MAG TPA: 4-(cytidine 5'-diphospho)-2-C-methyl-D-erythritol kinase [Candidatus Sulfotelmatobacter sp.]|jgi:4-diphosphocytidyl-2-C-methyl-D-erythritol kinase